MTPSTNQTTQSSETYYLWWLDPTTQKRTQAGVAFYEEGFGEYRLKIDFLSALLEKPGQFYLRSIGTIDNRILFRAEAVVKKNGKYAGRFPIGDGYSSKETDGEIHIAFGPFEKTLVLATQ